MVILNFTEILVRLSHSAFGMIILDGLMYYLVYNWLSKQMLFSNTVDTLHTGVLSLFNLFV